jgi:hypothetical protein
MSPRMRFIKKPQVSIDTARLQDAQEIVSKNARKAARQVGPTSRQARKMAASGMTSARIWGAPKIDRAGQYVEEEVGPRLGAMLHRTAGRVDPVKPRRRRGIAAALIVIGGALGAAGAVVTRRKMQQQSDDEATAPASSDHLSAVSKNSTSTERAHTS